MKLKEFRSYLFKKIVGEGRLKMYDEIEKLTTRYVVPSETLKDFFDEKYSTKRQTIQIIIVIIIWIMPIKHLIELIVYQMYDYHGPAYYTSYYGMALGKDEVGFTILGILVIICANHFHSFSKLVFINVSSIYH